MPQTGFPCDKPLWWAPAPAAVPGAGARFFTLPFSDAGPYPICGHARFTDGYSPAEAAPAGATRGAGPPLFATHGGGIRRLGAALCPVSVWLL